MTAGTRSPVAVHSSTPAELAERLAVERLEVPFLIWRNQTGRQLFRAIDRGERALTIGRRAGSDVLIDDDEVSRLHAELELIGEDWTIADDGLSRNGTYVAGDRVLGRRRLRDCDLVTVGRTTLQFRCPQPDSDLTRSAVGMPADGQVSAADRCVLVALCRPLRDAASSLPATNQQIAEELCLSVPAVKKRLGALFEQFGIAELPQNHKRVALAQAAIHDGVVGVGEL
jgi:hypothetical protein